MLNIILFTNWKVCRSSPLLHRSIFLLRKESDNYISADFFSEIIWSQCDVNVIESITNHFACMKLGQRMSKLLVNCCIATSWWNKQTFEIAKYLIIYAYDLCTTLGSSEWVQSLFRVVNSNLQPDVWKLRSWESKACFKP